MSRPRLRGNAPRREEPYSLGEIPEEVLVAIGRQCVHRKAIGFDDLSGDDFGTIFAAAVGGEHRASPLGIADVVRGACAWSVKTVKAKVPTNRKDVRLVSGRNAPDYSLGITDYYADSAVTGGAILSIWNARVNEALSQFDDLRVAVLVRNFAGGRFLIFEDDARRYIPSEYTWSFNKNNNLEGRETMTGRHAFTWQPHGSQFTIIRTIPASARAFSVVADVPLINADDVLERIGYDESWIEVD